MARYKNSGPAHAIETTNVADLLERILDKGVVIAGDIKVKLVDIELLTIQIRLVICSVEKAQEMGIDWWKQESSLVGPEKEGELGETMASMQERMAKLESTMAKA